VPAEATLVASTLALGAPRILWSPMDDGLKMALPSEGRAGDAFGPEEF
jgi:hypothetical protein